MHVTLLSLLLAMGLIGCGGNEETATNPAAGTPEANDGATADTSSPDAGTETAPVASASEAAPTADAAPAAESTLRYVPADAVAVIQFRPAKVMNNPLAQEFMKLAGELNPEENIEENLAEIERKMGVRPEQVQQVLIIVDQKLLAMGPMMMGGPADPAVVAGPDGPPGPVIVVDLVPGADTQAVLNAVPNSESTEVAGATGVTTPDGGVILPVSKTRLVYAKRSQMEATLNNSADGAVKSLIAQVENRDVSLAIDFAPVKALLQGVMQQNPNPILGMLTPTINNTETISLAADLSADQLLQIDVRSPNAEAAKAIESTLIGLIGMGKAQYQQAAAEIPAGLQPMTDQLVDGAALTTSGATVTLTIPRPENFDSLPTLLKPAIEEARKAAMEARKTNDLRQVGLAFHNYHTVFLSFPAVDGGAASVDENRRGKGLSWRVHLLPFVEESFLYQQFHLDEPWDSEHNKTLIASMPAIFGDDPEGKTSLHVFVGEGRLFNKDQPGKAIRDIVDGTANTILAVKAGADTADIWTKPGGLEADLENPVAALGSIGETFMILLVDGSVHELPATIDPTTLSNMIQHDDGNPVELP
jgi:hypothetical protein